jgi:hypothetical protein
MTAIPKLGAIWVFLGASPLLALTVTLIAYLIAQAIYAKARFNPLANPVFDSGSVACVTARNHGNTVRGIFRG